MGDLELMARGVAGVNSSLDKAKLIEELFNIEGLDPRSIRGKRKTVRKIILVMRERLYNPHVVNGTYTPEEQVAMEVIGGQLNSDLNLSWKTFTHTWDLHPTDFKKIVLLAHWSREGGKYDEIERHDPPAFTKQAVG